MLEGGSVRISLGGCSIFFYGRTAAHFPMSIFGGVVSKFWQVSQGSQRSDFSGGLFDFFYLSS